MLDVASMSRCFREMSVSQPLTAEMVAMHALSLLFSLATFTATPVYLHPPVGQPVTRQWEAAVTEAVKTGNDIHDELFGGEGITVAVDDAIDAAGDHCPVCGTLHEYDMFGVNPLDQFAAVIYLILQQKQSCHLLTANEKTMMIIVDGSGSIIFIDSHIHGRNGALVARIDAYKGNQAQSFSAWDDQTLNKHYGVGLSICSLTTVNYF